MMTQRRSRRALPALIAVLLLAGGTAGANHTDGDSNTGLFGPAQSIGTSIPYYGYGSSINFDTSHNDHAVTIKSYDVSIPAAWNIAMNSVDPSTQTTCAGLTPANTTVDNKGKGGVAERVGAVAINLHNDDTRGRSGAIPYVGYLWFLNYDTISDTTTLCGLATTGSALVPFANREIMFEVRLKHNGDDSLSMTWNYAAVTGAVPGSRSIFDNAYYQGKNTSILYTRVVLNTLSLGNYNKAPDGVFANVRFVWNPETIGNYTFTGTYTPCGAGDPGNCASNVSPAVRTGVVRIIDYPAGYHPSPLLAAPLLWSVVTGPDPVAIKWQQPTLVSGSDPTKGYIATISADYVPDSTKTLYLITDTGNPNVASPNPCGADGKAASCAVALPFPYTSDAGKSIAADGNFSMTLIGLFKDGHRSDGRCDDGTGVGSPPPCPDGSSPAISAGIARTQFLHRTRAWPLMYQQKIPGSKPNSGMWQIYVLLADLDGHEFEFIEWKPVGATYIGGGVTVQGSNLAGSGAIAYSKLNGPKHYSLDVVITPTIAFGAWVLTSSTNEIENVASFPRIRFVGGFGAGESMQRI